MIFYICLGTASLFSRTVNFTGLTAYQEQGLCNVSNEYYFRVS